jgi:lipoate-protein ligase A
MSTEATASHKVPDGKLVNVRVRYDETFEDVQVRGDFFLEPPEALDDIEAAVEGLPADAPSSEIAAAVAAVDAELVGFAPGDVATAVRAAVAGTD